MTGINRGRYTVVIDGYWRRYQIRKIAGYKMLGTVQRGLDIGALAISPAGLYVQINAGVHRLLDQRKTRAAIGTHEMTKRPSPSPEKPLAHLKLN